jgi:hypothetical protein
MKIHFELKVSKEFYESEVYQKALGEVLRDALLDLIKNADSDKIFQVFQTTKERTANKNIFLIRAYTSFEKPDFINLYPHENENET